MYLKLLLFPFVCLAFLATTLFGQSEQSTSFQGHFGGAGEFPVIQEMIVEKSFVAGPNRMVTNTYQFRYQTNGFFGRKLVSSQMYADEFAPGEVGAGHWENDYWNVDERGGKKLLFTYTFDPKDTNAAPVEENTRMMKEFSLVVTYGISESGVGLLKARGAVIETPNEWGLKTLATVQFSNSVPSSAQVKRGVKVGGVEQIHTIDNTYEYNPDVVPLPIPSVIKLNGTYQGETKNLATYRIVKVRLSQKPLAREEFFPRLDSIKRSDLTRIVYTNGQNHQVVGVKLIPMNISESEALGRLQARLPSSSAGRSNRWIIIGAFLATTIVVLGIIGQIKRKQNRKHEINEG